MPLENIAYVTGRIRELFGASGEIEHSKETKVGHEFHYFSNSHADYVACHVMKQSVPNDDVEFTWYLVFRQLYEVGGAIAIQGPGIEKLIADSQIEQTDRSAIVIGNEFIDAVGGDEAAAKFVYEGLKENQPYLAILRIPNTVSRPKQTALSTVCLISHDLRLYEDIAEKEARGLCAARKAAESKKN